MSESTPKKNGMATAALVIGIISIVLGFFGWLGIITGVLAIILAVVAKNQIKADPSMAGSAGAAKGGLITGIIGTVLGIVMIVIAILFISAVAEGFEDAALEGLENYEMNN